MLLGLLFRLPPLNSRGCFLCGHLCTNGRCAPLWTSYCIAILLSHNLLKETGRIRRQPSGCLNLTISSAIFVRVQVALLPARIGPWASRAGASVSAPMVVPGCDELNLSPERRTFINYWFRHVWEYVLPTFPASCLLWPRPLPEFTFKGYAGFNCLSPLFLFSAEFLWDIGEYPNQRRKGNFCQEHLLPGIFSLTCLPSFFLSPLLSAFRWS